MMQTEWRPESLALAQEIRRHAEARGITAGQFAFAWVLNNALVAGAIIFGVVLASFGLLATFWERRDGTPWPLRGSQLAGVAVFLTVTVGWFVLAYRQVGPHLIDDTESESQAR